MTTWEEIRDEVAGTLADGQPLEDVIAKLEKRKNEMKKTKPMTNEEWLHTMNAEQLAEFLVMIQMSVMHPVKRGAVDMEKFIEEVVDWLKQPKDDTE